MTKEEFISKLTDEPCEEGLEDFDEFSQRYDSSEPFEKVLTDFFLNHPEGVEYYWWCWEYGLPEQFKTDELFKSSALKRPWTALLHYSNLLDDKTFKECALKCPWAAVQFCSKRLKDLKDGTFEECVLKEPRYFLEYHSKRLDDELFKKCALREPRYVLIYCSKRLDDLGEEFKEKIKGLV